MSFQSRSLSRLSRITTCNAHRSMSTRRSSPLRIGYVPEHFSTPLYFAHKHFGLEAQLLPFPSGTGHMFSAIKSDEIDVGIGLTEGWVAGLGQLEGDPGFRLVGTYVSSPLRWAISTGFERELSKAGGLNSLRGKKMGVSRIGSGSYIMGYVLADQLGWLKDADKSTNPFEVIVLNTFDKLRKGVQDGTADFFMWEHFTSKRYYEREEIKNLGWVDTPWSSWKIIAREPEDSRVRIMMDKLNKGIAHFKANPKESVDYVSTELDYSAEDAQEWMKGVSFPNDVFGVDPGVVQGTIEALIRAGILEEAAKAKGIIGMERNGS